MTSCSVVFIYFLMYYASVKHFGFELFYHVIVFFYPCKLLCGKSCPICAFDNLFSLNVY